MAGTAEVAADVVEEVTDRAEAGRDAEVGRDAAESRALEAARTRLARGQSALLRALVAGATDPPAFDPHGFDVLGFDPDALAATRRVLLAKRRDNVARRWPILAADPAFTARFLSWADGRPPAGSWADGLAYGRAHRDTLSEAARVDLLRARCTRRRLAVLVDRAAVGTLIALRAPGLGVVILRAPR